MGLRVQGVGFRFKGSGFGVESLGFKVLGLRNVGVEGFGVLGGGGVLIPTQVFPCARAAFFSSVAPFWSEQRASI